MSSDGDSDFEHDALETKPEPAPQPRDAGATPAPQPGVTSSTTRPKIDIKMITIEPFDGTTREGYLDPGAYDWLERLKVQIFLAETLGGRKWPERVKCGVLASHLTGSGGTWFYRNSSILPTDSFRDLSGRFLNNFRCKLPTQAISVRLAKTRKFPTESYAEFAHRLSQIATGLNRGKANTFTEQQALSTFINHAYPRFRTDLEAKLDHEAEDATAELESAVDLLMKLARSDGRMGTNKRRGDDTDDRDSHDKKYRPSGMALAATSKSGRKRWDFSSAVCGTCDMKGHTTNFHDRHVGQQRREAAATIDHPPPATTNDD